MTIQSIIGGVVLGFAIYGFFHLVFALWGWLSEKWKAAKLKRLEVIAAERQLKTDVASIKDQLGRVNLLLAQKADKLTDDEKFFEASRIAANTQHAAVHAAKKTVEDGLNKIVPELVAKEMKKWEAQLVEEDNLQNEVRQVQRVLDEVFPDEDDS